MFILSEWIPWSKQKKSEGDLKTKLYGKRLYPTESVKYLGVKINNNLSWKYNFNDIFIKLNRPNTLLFKIGKLDSLNIFRSIYPAIFDSWLSYCSLGWVQNRSNIQRIFILQKNLELLIFNEVISMPVPCANKALF